MFIKTSILILYWRIFKPSRKANILLWIGIACNLLFYLGFIAIFVGTCTPRLEDGPTGGWLSPQFQARSHTTEGIISAVTGIVGSVINIYILSLPLVFLSGVHLPVRRKASVSVVFITGSGYILSAVYMVPLSLTRSARVCVFSIGCAIYRTWVATSSQAGRDMSWNAVIIGAIWSVTCISPHHNMNANLTAW